MIFNVIWDEVRADQICDVTFNYLRPGEVIMSGGFWYDVPQQLIPPQRRAGILV
jgi:hypothetical protein